MTSLSCKCATCKPLRAVLVPETFAPAVPRTSALAHGLTWQANHPATGAAFRAQTGVRLV